MAPISSIVFVASTIGAVSGYVSPSSFTGPRAVRNTPSTPKPNRVDTKVFENFGLPFAEDLGVNTPVDLLGEARYKQTVGTFNKNSFLNRQYNVIRRIRELDILGKTVDAGVLTKLEAQGVDLETLEAVLPTLEKLGALSFVGNNQQLLINGVAPALVEGAPFILPVVSGALGIGPPAFYLAAIGAFGADYFLLANNVELPFVGLSAGFYLGLLLVPVGAVLGGVGVALQAAGANK